MLGIVQYDRCPPCKSLNKGEKQTQSQGPGLCTYMPAVGLMSLHWFLLLSGNMYRMWIYLPQVAETGHDYRKLSRIKNKAQKFITLQIVNMMSVGRKHQGLDGSRSSSVVQVSWSLPLLSNQWFHHLSMACDTLHKLWADCMSSMTGKAPHMIIGLALTCTTISLTLPYCLVLSSNFNTVLIRTLLKNFSPKTFKSCSSHLIKWAWLYFQAPHST